MASNGEYTMLGLDLKSYEDLGSSFKALHIDYSVPTLFLSECAVTYMDIKRFVNLYFLFLNNHALSSVFMNILVSFLISHYEKMGWVYLVNFFNKSNHLTKT